MVIPRIWETNEMSLAAWGVVSRHQLPQVSQYMQVLIQGGNCSCPHQTASTGIK